MISPTPLFDNISKSSKKAVQDATKNLTNISNGSRASVELARGTLKNDIEKKKEEEKQRNKEAQEKNLLDQDYHDVFQNYLNIRGKGGKDYDYIGKELAGGQQTTIKDPEFVSNWFTEEKLRPEVLILLQKIIPNKESKDTGEFKDTKLKRALPNTNKTITGDELLFSLKNPNDVNHTNALEWVKGLEKYIWDIREKPENIREKGEIELAKQDDTINNLKSNIVEDVLYGSWDKLTSLEPSEMAPVAFVLFALWRANKEFHGKVFDGIAILGAAYGADVLQSEFTNLNGGQKFLDTVLQTTTAYDLRNTSMGAMLTRMNASLPPNLEDRDYNNASFLMQGVPMSEIMDWWEQVKNLPGDGTSEQYTGAMVGKLKSGYSKLMGTMQYTEENKIRALQAMHATVRAFMMFCGEKAEGDRLGGTHDEEGLLYLKVRYTNYDLGNIPQEKREKYAQHRKHMGIIREEYLNSPPSFYQVLQQEVSLDVIQESVKTHENTAETFQKKWGEFSDFLAPYMKDLWDWSTDQIKALKNVLSDTVAPYLVKTKDSVYKFTGDNFRDASINFNLWKAKHSGDIEELKKIPGRAVEIPFEFVGWVFTSTVAGLEATIKNLTKFYGNYLKPWANTIDATKKDTLVELSSGNDILGVLDKTGIKEKIKTTYGLVRDEDVKTLCDRLAGTTFQDIVNTFRNTDTATPYDATKKQGKYTWGKTGTVGKSDSETITQGEIVDVFYQSLLGFEHLAGFLVNGTIGAERAVFEGMNIVRAGGTFIPEWFISGIIPGVTDVNMAARTLIKNGKIDYVNTGAINGRATIANIIEEILIDAQKTPLLVPKPAWTIPLVINTAHDIFDIAANTTKYGALSPERREGAKVEFFEFLLQGGKIESILNERVNPHSPGSSYPIPDAIGSMIDKLTYHSDQSLNDWMSKEETPL